uniref:NADH dehydrogenase subunit 2 n=1 Tax=Penthe kochi TaxID=2952706 RepID=UPI0021155EA3|nr:NADH dehydrogenase subunit 2 [Penthe kochi]USG58922.1 NADH dehydrogenase subunit 2 [Penthe kochi]
MMKFYKIMFFNLMIIGTLISISAYSWISMWMGLEINLMSIIPLMKNLNKKSSESSIKYFFIQTLASLILLFSVILMLLSIEFITPKMNSTILMILNSSLLMKMGAAPFHFWFPEIMEGLNWMNCFIMLTWQKVAPMILLMNNKININFIFMTIILSLIVGSIMGMNQTSLRKFLTFSSINHIAWMISSMLISINVWLIYFTIYTIITMNIIILFMKSNSFYFNQLFNWSNKNKLIKLSLMFNFLSLSGLPPFLGFLPKWILINWLIQNNFFILTFMLIIITLITIYMYIRIMFSSMMINHNENLNNMKLNNFTLIYINFINLSLMIIYTSLYFLL